MDSAILIISVLLVSFVVIAFAIVYPVSRQPTSETRISQADKRHPRYSWYKGREGEDYDDAS